MCLVFAHIAGVLQVEVNDECAAAPEVSPTAVAISSVRPRATPQTSSSMFGDRYAKHLPSRGAAKPVATSGRTSRNIADTLTLNTPSTAITSSAPSSDGDPAYRVKLMECINYMWPLSNTGNNSATPIGRYNLLVTEKRQKILSWVYLISKGEIWSIKRQGLLILSSIVPKWSDISQEEMGKVVKFISDSYVSNTMHSQVREASLFCLRRILEDYGDSDAVEVLRGSFAHEVRVILLQAQPDNSPGVLDELHRIRSIWKGGYGDTSLGNI